MSQKKLNAFDFKVIMPKLSIDEGPLWILVTMAPVGHFDQWAMGRRG